MNTSNRELSRLTIDIPKEVHKRLKAISVVQEKSLREIIIEAIDLLECPQDHTPNEETRKILDEVLERKGLIKCKDANEFFEKLGLSDV